ncbi:MAG: hypothetical protein ACREAE_10025, partial [Nitrosopumilaceae archaeon]
GHGDARRAIDLLRVAAELAMSKNEKLSESHVDMASDELQKDRIGKVLANASYHLKLVAASLARITFLTGEVWHSTSVLYNQYCKIIRKGTKSLGYRRVSELLTELENTGLVVSQTSSKGRHGYGTQYKLVVPPEMVGMTAFSEWWKGVIEAKIKYDATVKYKSRLPGSGSPHLANLLKTMEQGNKKIWDDYVGRIMIALRQPATMILISAIFGMMGFFIPFLG